MLRRILLAAMVSTAGCQVIGIDFGSDFIKVAGVKPGKMGIDVVLNEQSKRKSNNFIGYRGDDRFIGEDAFNLAPRFPDQMYTFLNRVAGKEHKEGGIQDEFKKNWNLPYNFERVEPRGVMGIVNPDPATTYTPEELIAQLLGYIKNQAAVHMEIPVTGTVITVPSFLSASERESFVHAANLTGLTCLGLMSSTLSAALQYGVQKRGFGNETVNLMIYDMGASRTEVGLYRFTPPEEVDGKPKRGGELGHLQTLAVAHDETLGGRTMDARIADFLAKKFEEKNPSVKLIGSTEKAALKAMTVLMRRANKAKEVLSANKEAIVSIEELYDGKPFFYTFQRTELDEQCEDLFQRATPPMKRVLELSGVKPEELSAVEIIGGGVRIPRLQAALSEALGGRSLDKTLNGDECMALGAAFQAAKLSGTFRTKGFTVSDRAPYNVTFQLSQLPGSNKPPKMRPLFSNPEAGSKKSITVARTEDFDVNLFTSTENDEGVVEYKKWKTLTVKNVASTLETLGFNKEGKNASNTHAIQLQVRYGFDDLVNAESAVVKYDEHMSVMKKIKIKEPKPEEKKEEEKKEEDKKEEDDTAKPAKDEEPKPEEPKAEESKEEAKKEGEGEKKEGEEEKKEGEEEKKPEEPKYKFVNKTEIKKHRQQADVEVSTVVPHPMGEEDYNKSTTVLEALQKIEDLKKEAAAAKNDLETYIYWVKFEGVLDFEEMQEFITEDNRKAIEAALEEVGDWVEFGEGSNDGTPLSEFVAAKEKLQKEVNVVIDKKKEKEDAERKAIEEEMKAKQKEEKERKKKEKEEKKAAQEKTETDEEKKEDGEPNKEPENEEPKKEETEAERPDEL
eukprot:TRINITY_DN6781_c0_g2_i1.p1 TRINITY_DN6781_c0_g2~~TRINITY_DN6781_c0_g2_i1.p1  ORF type:complete len:844 (+),score=297.18 TRINITY_DN6781_c0_g2_i1:39-2570(+)